jgi:hypothetical protein
VRLRFDSASRAGPADVGDAYVTAPATGARVPLRAVADVRAEWAPSRIVRRNGVRTVSVLAYAQPGVLASTVLAAARPGLEAVALPAGYRLAYGGEVENQGEVQGPMAVALSVVAARDLPHPRAAVPHRAPSAGRDGLDPARPLRQRARAGAHRQPVRLHREPRPHRAHRRRGAQRDHPR